MFYYSLPLFFNQIKGATPSELFGIVLLFLLVLSLTAPPPEQKEEVEQSLFDEHYVHLCWLGLKPLWTVFWPWFVFFNLVVFGVDSLVLAGQLSASSWDDVYFVLCLPSILWTIAVWRNSANTQYRIWAALARLMTLALWFEYGLKWVIRFDYARIFFNCNEVVLDYAACF